MSYNLYIGKLRRNKMVKFGVLDKLGQKYNTDKASQYTRRGNLTKGHDYLRHYELFLSTLLDEPFTLIELGCYTGASLKMWKEYYAKAHIIGVDLDEKLARLEEERISFVCSDAVADDLPQKLSKFNENIMCIIDDCSHAWGDQRRTFEMLFPMVNSGGFYIIEDLECGALGAYPNYPPKVLDAQVFWDYAMDRMKILRVSENRNQVNYRPFFNQLPPHIQALEKSIDMAFIVPGAIIFRKK